MPTKWEKMGKTKAPLEKAMDYYWHPENLPKVHPDFVKEVKILSSEGDTIKLEQHARIMGRNLMSVNTLKVDRAANTFNIDTLEGDGKGSKISIALKSAPDGTELWYAASMELGPLGFFAKGPAKAQFEKTVDEDVAALNAA